MEADYVVAFGSTYRAVFFISQTTLEDETRAVLLIIEGVHLSPSYYGRNSHNEDAAEIRSN